MGRLTLRRRLTLLVALTIVVPITAVGVTVVNIIGNEAEQRTFERLRLTSAAAQAALEDHRADMLRAIDALADSDALAAAVAEDGDLEPFLRQSLAALDLDVLVVTSADGSTAGSARRAPEVSRTVKVPTDEELVGGAPSPVAMTATAQGTSGVVHGAVWLDAPRLRVLARAEDVVLATIDDGRVIAATGPLGALPERDLQGEFTDEFGGRERFAIAGDVAGTGATLLVATPPSATASQLSLIVLFGALLVVLVVLVVLVGYVVSGLVTGPVEQVVDAALAVARGDLTKRVGVTGDREMVALATAFNQMTDNLQEYVTQLEQSRSEFQQAIARLGDVLVSTHDIPGILDVVLEVSTLTIKADLVVFYERVAMPARIRASAAHGAPLADIELNGSGVAGTAAIRGTPITFPGGEPLDASEPDVSSAIAVPVMSEGRLFGVLAAYGRQGQSLFSAGDVDTLQTFARQAEVAIGNVMLHDETRRQARTDGLTGLWNRREFELRAREQVREADRYGEPFGVVLVDLDDFKQVNDRFDHTTGDAALIWVAARLAEATRDSDIVARWGGEEFIVLLPRQGVEETAAVAERVRAAVAREPMVEGPRIIPLTVSAGYAVHPADGASADELFKSADAALLRAKRLGKNRIERAATDEGVA